MTLLISIEYRTRWGEQLVLRLGKRRIALQYADGGVWTCAVERYAPAAQPAEYRYEVEREGVCIRSEWRPHTLRIPSREGVRTLRIRDRWQEMPSDTPFYSSAFTRGIFGRGKTGNPKKAAGNITLRVILPTLRPDETLAVAGSGRELGDWKRIVPMDDSRFPEWELTLHTAHRFEYKFLIADRKTLTPILWEEGANRTWGELPGAGEHALDAAAYPRFPERRWQGAGTAIPVFSLRTEEDFGVGEFYDLKRLIDWAAATGQCVIQVLRLGGHPRHALRHPVARGRATPHGRIHGYLQFHDHRPPDRHRTDRRCHRQVLLRLRRGRHAGARRGIHAAGRRVGLPGQRTQGPMTYNP